MMSESLRHALSARPLKNPATLRTGAMTKGLKNIHPPLFKQSFRSTVGHGAGEPSKTYRQAAAGASSLLKGMNLYGVIR